MTTSRHRQARTLLLLAACASSVACSAADIANFNSPNTSQLENTPNAATVNTTVAGVIGGSRAGAGTWAATLGIFGREIMNLDGAEPRNVLALLIGPLEPGGFGTDAGWTNSYRNLRTATTLLSVVDNVPDYSAAQKSAVKGFVKTFMALEYMNQLRVRDTFGLVFDVPKNPAEQGAFITRDEAFTKTAALFDEALTDLNAGGTAFPFALTTGFTGFNTPANFVRVNRGLKARLETYRGRWADVLTALNGSFISTAAGTAATFNTGVFHVYSTASGDAVNPLFDPAPRAIVAVPEFLTDARLRADGTRDLRATSKAVVGTVTLATQSISSNVRPVVYPTNVTPIPLIRNEELILMRAEANIGLGNRAAAIADLNFVRTNAGGLPALAADFSGDLVTELLYDRRYSLFFEYGHRWVDARRYNRLGELKRQLASHRVFPLVPIPVDECNQRLAAPPRGCVNVLGN
ncbi:MAG: RagB/SusD family nutrient uptake outer membrane protein [Gemmatimonadota bacterium]|nr:RagB/SusD family nutrient uptake outer membrane protein [Gemmatimonadota bacterium]MDQ8167398.1 RagB/SusD family nutrient uptake outer membrane protein [Gemmatimonadota bacterium]MDQ8172988.1 RagB/SusD family nutrient uptake outer membrane protein [Gemmatimonadota bacterium]